MRQTPGDKYMYMYVVSQWSAFMLPVHVSKSFANQGLETQFSKPQYLSQPNSL